VIFVIRILIFVSFHSGEYAIRSLTKIARQLVTICEISYRRDLLECCLNIENLLLKYQDLLHRRLVHTKSFSSRISKFTLVCFFLFCSQSMVLNV